MQVFNKNFQQLTKFELYEILKLRVDTFVVEQNCPYPEIDRIDYHSQHIFIKEKEEIIAYLRIFEDKKDKTIVHIGRVLTKYRKKGLGKILMKNAIEIIKLKKVYDKIHLEAQVYVKRFYEEFGFKNIGEEYLEDGIAHILMQFVIKK